MKRFWFALLVAFSATAPTSVLAQTYPNRTIRIVVPYAPGGGVSVYANLISGKLSEIVKQSVVVENRPGAGGNVGSDVVAKSPPDGYTVLLHTSALASAGPLNKSLTVRSDQRLRAGHQCDPHADDRIGLAQIDGDDAARADRRGQSQARHAQLRHRAGSARRCICSPKSSITRPGSTSCIFPIAGTRR